MQHKQLRERDQTSCDVSNQNTISLTPLQIKPHLTLSHSVTLTYTQANAHMRYSSESDKAFKFPKYLLTVLFLFFFYLGCF